MKKCFINQIFKSFNFRRFNLSSLHNTIKHTFSNIAKSKSQQKDLNSRENGYEYTNLKSDIVINNNEEILLYYSKEPLFNSFFFHFKYTTIISLLVYFIRTNPLFLSFPAALPISAFFLCYKIGQYVLKLKDRKHIVTEIWIDKINEELVLVFDNNILKRNIVSGKVERVSIKSITDKHMANNYYFRNKLPYTINDFNKNENINLYKYWTKYYSVEKDYFSIYKWPIYNKYENLLDVIYRHKKVNIVLNKDSSNYLTANNSTIDDLLKNEIKNDDKAIQGNEGNDKSKDKDNATHNQSVTKENNRKTLIYICDMESISIRKFQEILKKLDKRR